jgi:putative transposase
LESILKLYGIGKNQAKSDRRELLVDKDVLINMSSKNSSQNPNSERKSSTAGSQAESKRQTSGAKSNTCKNNSPGIELLAKLPPECSTNDQVFGPFWNSFCQEWSRKLPLHTTIASGGSDSTYSNPFVKQTERKYDASWMKIFPHKNGSRVTSSQLLPHLLLEHMDKENMAKQEKTTSLRQKDLEDTKCDIIVIQVPGPIKKIFKTWMNFSRNIYNWSLSELRKPRDKKLSKTGLRNDAKKYFLDQYKGLNMPCTSLEYAVFEAHKNWTQFGKKCKFKKSHQLKQEISLDTRNLIKNGQIYPTNVKSQLVKAGYSQREAKKMTDEFVIKKSITSEQISKLIWDKQSGKMSLAIPKPVKFRKRTTRKNCLASVDPGVSPFATYYSLGSWGMIGEKWYQKAKGYLKKSDELLKKEKESARHWQKARLRKAAARCRLKVQNIVKNLHYQGANFLTKSFQYILLPKMNTKNMVSTEKRNISRHVARAIMTSSQYRFRQILIRKAKENSSTVILCKEHYTSKTCSNCGSLKNDLGSKKVYECDNCGITLHRDYNGARNILIRNLTLDRERSNGISLSDGSFPSDVSTSGGMQ